MLPATSSRRRIPLKLSLYFFFLCFICLVFPIKSDGPEAEILLDFKSALAKSNTSAFDSWSRGGGACNFTGIVCNSAGLVTEIVLPSENLTGIVPFDSVCKLQWLEKISLELNFLYGSVSDGLKNCTRLRYLDLSNNLITGKVPDLFPLKVLELLNLNASAFSGIFPWKSLENLTNLAFLSLGDNQFDESPIPNELMDLEKLYWLYLTNCSLIGQIPTRIGNLARLENLELSDNHLSGEFPSGITALRNLRQLELYNNNFTGKIPAGFRNLTNLVRFDASQNSLEGNLTELKFLTNLASLQLFENQLSGEIPEEIGEFRNLKELSLYTNRFSGSLPRNLGSWADFRFIDVSDNLLTGTIPPDMCKRNKMVDFLVLQNGFTGGIPATYSNCSSLVRLRLNSNSLSGQIPAGIWSLPKLRLLDVTFNQFEGPITPNIGDAKSLAQLFLSNNRFSGELPPAISRVSSLVAVVLKSNRFTGRVPAEIGELKNLYSLQFEGNMFFGAIPDSLGSCTSLNDINLAGNSFSGEIPATIGFLPSLNSLNLSDNNLSGDIPASLSSLKLSLLDLSDNELTGRIPDSLSIQAFNASFSGNPGLCSQSFRNLRPCSPDSGRHRNLRTLISCFVAGTTVLMISFGCFLFMKMRGKDLDGSGEGAKVSWDMKPFQILSFTEQEILNSIKQENLIGKGGSGNVYKVALKNGQVFAVKHIWRSYNNNNNNPAEHHKSCRSSTAMLSPQRERRRRMPEYDAEVAALSSVRHVNVVKLHCSITSEDSNLLVYEYLTNGSLWDQMHSGSNQKMALTWQVRYHIAVGAARGLEYLHHCCDRPVIHRDVKSSNILLDEELKPRIADFGLAKIVQANVCGSVVADSTQIIAGTHGYIAPEYAYTNKVNEKSDVYSFGVVLMELVTGKRPVEPGFGDSKDIVWWVWSKAKNNGEGCALELVDPNIGEAEREDAFMVLRIAVQCTAKLPALRPSMRRVVQMLEEVESCAFTDIVIVSKHNPKD